MKKLLLLFVALSLCATGAYAEMTWSPTPLVIDAPSWVQYDFDGEVDIPFETSGKSATVWLVIETKLDEDQKPVNIHNGFKNWHYVNGIDTTIYVSTSQTFEAGTGHSITWDGRGNEKEYDVLQSADQQFAGTDSTQLTFYLWGYDHASDREVAIDFISIGSYWEGQYARFYVNDDQGVPYETPMFMGQRWTGNNGATGIGYADIFKWQLGLDPFDSSLNVVSDVVEFDEEFPDVPTRGSWEVARYGYGPGVFDPNDHNTFYFTKNRFWGPDQTMVKYTFVPDGQAQQDLSWGDYSNYFAYTHPGNKYSDTVRPGLLSWEYDGGDYLLVLDGGQNPLTYRHDKFRIHDMTDPWIEIWNGQLGEFYMPEQPNNDDGSQRTASEINRLAYGPHENTILVTGDWSCLTECLNLTRLFDGSKENYADDGYVTWANSNGDFFLDMSPNPDLTDFSEQLWACIVSDPRNANNPREELANSDMNGFTVSYLEFVGTNSFGVYCPDGSGIDIAKFNDDAFSTGTSGDRTKKGGGEILDYGGTYDGLYMQSAVTEDAGTGSGANMKTNWVAFDSDSGILSKVNPGDPNTGVEGDAPAAFTVAQNSPNPFNPTTTINYNLANSGQVVIDVLNIAGQKVDTLVNDYMTAGSHSVVWDAADFAAGTYFYTVKAGNYSETMKMTLLK